MWVLFVGLSMFFVLFGLANLTGSTATIGVGCIGVACQMAIFARIAQAQGHFKAAQPKQS